MEWYTLIVIIVNIVALILFFKSILFSKKPQPFTDNNLSDFEIQRLIDEELKRRETYDRKPEEYQRD